MGRTKEIAWRNTDVHVTKKQKILPFRSNKAETRYNSYTSRQTLFMERGLTCSEYNPLVTQVIQAHEWETFCQHPSYASIPFVREFYANYDATKPNSVYVRGKLIDVSSSAINSFFSLTDHQNTFFGCSSNLSFIKMRKILKDLTEPGTQWASKEDMTFPRRSLKAGPKIWNKFIKYNLLPSSHDKIVDKDTAILLYCIMAGKPINVGEVIAKQIGVCAGLNEGGLWFPALITRLCTQSNVSLSHTKQMKEHSDPLYVKSQSDNETSESDEETNQGDEQISHSDQESRESDQEISQGDQEINQSDHDPLSPITISSDQSRDDIMQISSGKSDDDELLDVEHESCELAEDMSPMSDCAQSVEHGEKLVGSRIKVWWPEDKTYYEGVVKSFNSRRKKHKVLYDVGDEECLDLKKEQWGLIENVSPMPDCAQSVKHGEKLVGSNIEVSSSLPKIHEGIAKSFGSSEKKHEVLIDDNDDGIEELLNLTKEHAELAENVSPVMECLQSGIICVQGYKVKENVGPILKSIFEKHGDIAAECVFKTASVRSYLLESVCEVVTRIQTNDYTEKMNEIEWKVSDAAAANINVSWIRAHLDTIHKRKDSVKKSSFLMETKANTVLATLAAQKDLIEKCEELVAAQERFANAERCVRVLLLVDKNLNNDILESKAGEDSWVEQPIL